MTVNAALTAVIVREQPPYKASLIPIPVLGLAARLDHNGLAVLLRDGSEGPG
jgi:hypothetical protein